MSGASNPDDGAQVDVEAAWAQIVLHWDDDTSGTPATTAGPAGPAGDAQPQAPEAGTVPPQPPKPPVPRTDAARLARRQDRRANRGRDAGRPLGAVPVNPLRPVEPLPPMDAQPEPDGHPPDARTPQGRPPGSRAHDGPAAASPADSSPPGVRPAGPRDWEGPLDEEGFVPQEPPPLPRGDLVSRLAWGGVLGAPLFLLLAALFWRTAPTLLVATAVTAFVVGFATLVVRMPDRRPDDGDDGAVV